MRTTTTAHTFTDRVRYFPGDVAYVDGSGSPIVIDGPRLESEKRRPVPMPAWRRRALFPQSEGVSDRFATAGAVDYTATLRAER